MLGARASALHLAAFAALAIAASQFVAPSVRASDSMGPESCRACHAEAYKIWSEGPHARAAQALDEKQRRQPLCLYCHSRDEVRSGQALVSSVSCETCHGGGRFYQAEMVMRDKELAHMFGLADIAGPNAGPLCLSCHGGEQAQVKPFDLPAALTRIDHWTADRAARKAQKQSQRDPHPGQNQQSEKKPETHLAHWLAAARAP